MRRDIIVKNSSGGMANDPFERDASKAHILEHYDIATDPNKLIPHLSAEDGDSSAATNAIKSFAFDGTTIYGLGTVTSGGILSPCIFKRTDFTGAIWAADSHGSLPAGSIPSSASITDDQLVAFTYYRTTGKLYGVRDNRYICSVTPGSTFSPADADLTSFSTVSNFHRHSKTDRLYLGYDNKIASKNGSSAWVVAALTLPANYVVTSIDEEGNFLAIGCKDKNGGKSRRFLWDQDDSLQTLTDGIDCGEGNLVLLGNLSGVPVTVSFTDSVNNAIVAQTRVTIRAYSGSLVIDQVEFTGLSLSPGIQSTLYKQSYRNRILFPATIPIGTTAYSGIWSISLNPVTHRLSVVLEYLYRDTGTPSTRYGILAIGDIVFASYAQNVSGTPTMFMDKTNDVAAYTTASVRESLINPNMPEEDRDMRKQLVFGGLSYGAPITSGQQAVLKYRVDGGSWRTIFTETTTGKIVSEKIISGLIGRDLEFRDESTGGLVITGLRYKYDVLRSLL